MVDCMGLGLVEDDKRPRVGLRHLMQQNIQFGHDSLAPVGDELE